MFTLTRSEKNPLLSPNEEHPWESMAAFNACPVVRNRKTVLVYRAMSGPDLLKPPHMRMSVIARAVPVNGEYTDRKVLIHPDRDFDRYGCEDPRVTKMDGKYYIFYTALGGYPFSAENIRIAVAISDDLETITEKHLVTTFNSKGMALFSEKINGKYAALVTINTDQPPSHIVYVEFDKMEDILAPTFWTEWMKKIDDNKLNIRRRPDEHIELGAAPIMTDKGWLIVYAHIQRYGHSDQAFGVEAVLLDKNDPRKVIGRTKGPFMIPEVYYERVGDVANVIFPSGTMIRGDKLEIYYGAADTHCALATIPINDLLYAMTGGDKEAVKRFPGNPIISPRNGLFWEMNGTINPAAIDIDNKVHILYRAVSDKNVSTMGYAISHDGYTVSERPDKPIYMGRAPFETNGSGNNCGCEDARITEIDGRLYITYSGYDGMTPRVVVSSIAKNDFLEKRWGAWASPEAITPPGIPDKDAVILPEKVNGKYMVIHRVNDSICADFVDSLDFSKEKVNKCIEIVGPRHGMWDGHKVGISTPPIKTEDGWLLLYHGVSWSSIYRVGAILLDLDDPTVVKARTAVPFLEPEEAYETAGVVSNVVFPCGMIVRNDTVMIYYGGGDKVVGVVTVKLSVLKGMLKV
ncbi:MAG: hypothetical protein WCG02_03290 [Candidatus Taylorbacteria bacterium]